MNENAGAGVGAPTHHVHAPAHQYGVCAYFQAEHMALVHHAPGARSYLSVSIGSL